MEQKVNPWKNNLTNGLIIGLVGVVWSLVIYFLDLTFKQALGYFFMIVQIILLFFLVKSYRDNYMHGQITYGQAVGAGVIIILYSAILMAVFNFILYSIIDPELTAKKMAFMEELMLKKGTPQAGIDAFMKIQEKLLKPIIQFPLNIIGGVFGGTILSLLIAIFVRKEGNTLIETPQNEA